MALVRAFAGTEAMSFAERLAIGLVILSLILGIALLWLTSSPTRPCEELGDWAKPVCKHLGLPGESRPFGFTRSEGLDRLRSADHYRPFTTALS
jgi:hypothetical protein